jgi:hypothetical protein
LLAGGVATVTALQAVCEHDAPGLPESFDIPR